MLLKYTQYQKRTRLAGSGKPQRSTGSIKGLNGKGKGHRKGMKGTAHKRLNNKSIATKREEVPASVTVDPCDNSNDSGLGFDHHLEIPIRRIQSNFVEHEYVWGGEGETKRQRLDIKVESDNANDNFTFSQTRLINHPTAAQPVCARGGKALPPGKGGKRGNQCITNQSVVFSRDGKVQLQILSQPETQHRARYQTEGSRGAVKDRTGNGFPIVKLVGYKKSTTLEVYIGTDQGRVAPHMFYQACRVSGKNSTPCIEKKVDGTVLIEIELDPLKDMTATCDCVGILKERNVDVEHRFPEESSGRSKKKSTRCRMVFRTVITNDDNTTETLQVTSQPIICTQPPGVPEICKKSLTSCPASGNLELFILGKNFLKDTRVVFSEGDLGSDNFWEILVHPDKEFLQQSHLVCVIPPYRIEDIKEPVIVKLLVLSSGRRSEAHTFMYTPVGTNPIQALSQEPTISPRTVAPSLPSQPVFPAQNLLLGVPFMLPASKFPVASSFLPESSTIANKCKEENGSTSPVLLMPPPTGVPVSVRRSSQSTILPENIDLKREAETPPTEPVQVTVTPDFNETCQPSMATLRQFVSTPNTPLPALSVETYFSKIESKLPTATNTVVPQPTALLLQKQERAEGINDLLTSQALQQEITASMMAQNGVHETVKLDAFVNSTIDSQIDPTGSPERDVSLPPLPMQTSPLNLNTHENITLTTPVSIEHILPLQNQMSSPILANDIVTNNILDPTGAFSPGKDITNVSDNINITAPVSTATFTTPPPTTNEIIMKAVTEAQFPPAQEMVITSTIKEVLSSSPQQTIQNGPMIRPEDYVSPPRQLTPPDQILEKTDPSSALNPRYQQGLIIDTVYSLSKETVSPRTVDNKSKSPPISTETQFSPSLVLNNNHFASTNESTTRINATSFPENIVFQNPDLALPTSQTSVSTFASDVVVAEVKNQFNAPSFPNTTDNTNLISSKLTNTFPTSLKTDVQSQQDTGNIGRPMVTNSPFINNVGTTINGNNDLKVGANVGAASDVPRCSSEIQKQVAPQVDELARMSENDLLSYINPSCFDQV